jgi:hypothetical protein
MTSALFGLLGVFLGAALSWAGTAWSEHARRQHEWVLLGRSERLAAYGEFSMATKEYVAVLYRVAGGLGIDSQTERLGLNEAEPLLADAFHTRDTAFERMRLVGSSESVERARAWVQAIYQMRESLRSPNLDASGWEALVARANQARDTFHVQARAELALQ